MKFIVSIFTFFLFAISVKAQSFYQESPAAVQWVDSVFGSLSPRQRIAQLMVVRLSEKTANGVVFTIRKWKMT